MCFVIILFFHAWNLFCRPGDHCLLDHHNVTFNLTSIMGQQQPGQRYSPNVQCVIIYGPGSYYCGVKMNSLMTFQSGSFLIITQKLNRVQVHLRQL